MYIHKDALFWCFDLTLSNSSSGSPSSLYSASMEDPFRLLTRRAHLSSLPKGLLAPPAVVITWRWLWSRLLITTWFFFSTWNWRGSRGRVSEKLVYWGGTRSSELTPCRRRSWSDPAFSDRGTSVCVLLGSTASSLRWSQLCLSGLHWVVCKESVEYHFIRVEQRVPPTGPSPRVSSVSKVFRRSLSLRFPRRWKGSQPTAVQEQTDRRSSFEPEPSLACHGLISFCWQIISPSNRTVWAASCHKERKIHLKGTSSGILNLRIAYKSKS